MIVTTPANETPGLLLFYGLFLILYHDLAQSVAIIAREIVLFIA